MLLLLYGCGRSGEPVFSVEALDSGVIQTTWSSLPLSTLEVDTIAVWDVWSGESGYHFNRLTTVAGIEDGFYVLDSGNRQVVETDLAGQVRNVFGERGEGPGEFGFPRFLNVVGDEVWVGDIMPMRFSVFSLDGTHQRTVLSQARLAPDANRCAILPDGRVLNALDAIDGLFSLLRWDLSTNTTDTLATLRSMPPIVIELHRSDGRVVPFDTRPTFAPELHWSYSPPGRLLTVTSEEYLFEERDLTGRIIRRTLAPTPDLTVTEREREHFLSTAVFASSDGASLSNEEIRKKWKFADRRQAIGGIRTDPSGRIWVLANTGNIDSPRIDLFNSEHHYLGSLDARMLPLAFSANGTALFRIPEGEGGADVYFTAMVH